ncbi:response regulator [Candidatus Marinarcus aquaticus]|uniref:Response regulatory domain-containing protein n=1 Tax=Candidatus Marinarcus aquaticus TaxID=2044504 RepID=A0A4Q0XRU6_9BACT|nr:response regulator [Candidatus Marinarcus aquaticus]RXJ60247.1 hypothetical protein CRV04_04385 [Candidatus Marinarcus aquaticus]
MQRVAELKKLARNLTALIVETQSETIDFFKENFKNIFKELIFEKDGLRALESYKKHQPDIVITEYEVEEMNSLALIKNIKKVNRNAQIIVVSTKKDATTVLKMVHTGIVDFLPKPIDKLLLHNALVRGMAMTTPINALSEKVSSESPIESLKALEENNNEIQLISDYKGIPIIHKGTIVYIHKDYVEIQTRKIQTKAIEFNGKTIIESEYLSGDIEGKLLSIDNKNGQVALSGLKFIEYTPKRRKYARIVPSSDMKLMAYKKGGAKIDITLVSISINNLTFKIKHLPDFFKEDTLIDLKLAFEIPESDLAYYVDKLCISNFQGKILKITPMEDYYIIGITFEIPKINEDVFKKYLYTRELQLIEEFKKFARG